MKNAVTVLESGVLASIQDFGRHKYLDQGFTKGGVMDPQTVSALNTLIGNRSNAPVIEFFQLGPKLQFNEDCVISIGGRFRVFRDKEECWPWSRLFVRAGQVIDLVPLRRSAWGYIAFSGGIDQQGFFGSVESSLQESLQLHGSDLREEGGFGIGRELRFSFFRTPVRCVRGAQWDWFSEDDKEAFFKEPYEVSLTSNRVGYRLEGGVLERGEGFLETELKSEGACAGTVQVSNSGAPIILMADAQTIGGYPKLAHVIQADLGKLAQIPPGGRVRFELVSYEEAITSLKSQKEDFAQFSRMLSL